jgi:type IV secretory pathway VirB3-like protein
MMRRNLAYGGVTRPALPRGVSSLACLVFVAVLGVAFWAGALWIAQILVRMSQTSF